MPGIQEYACPLTIGEVTEESSAAADYLKFQVAVIEITVPHHW
jgi:hypothetical protein